MCADWRWYHTHGLTKSRYVNPMVSIYNTIHSDCRGFGWRVYVRVGLWLARDDVTDSVHCRYPDAPGHGLNGIGNVKFCRGQRVMVCGGRFHGDVLHGKVFVFPHYRSFVIFTMTLSVYALPRHGERPPRSLRMCRNSQYQRTYRYQHVLVGVGNVVIEDHLICSCSP